MAHKVTWQSHASPRWRLRGVDVARTSGGATRVHVDAWVAPRGKRVFGLARGAVRGALGVSPGDGTSEGVPKDVNKVRSLTESVRESDQKVV